MRILIAFLIPVVGLFASAAQAAERAFVIPAPALDETAHADKQTVVLAGGCFWGVQAVFQHTKGVTSAVSGYAGGDKSTAHYETVGTGRTGHAESVSVSFDPPTRPLFVEAHKGQIQQVLLNLLLNATQAMPDGGTITLAITTEERAGANNMILDITDTGTGVDEIIRDRIFDSFLSGRPGGTGLGLAIAKRILISHHGDIALHQTSAAGTTMQNKLPLAK